MVENLGNIGEFVGGIGVVITLFYLAFQVRASRLQTLAEDTTNAVRGSQGCGLLTFSEQTFCYVVETLSPGPKPLLRAITSAVIVLRRGC